MPIRTKPLPFQITGIKQIEKWNGIALLSDEMGLGKTIQALMWAEVFLWGKKHRSSNRPMIVVCPAGLKYNWEREVSKHLGRIACVIESRKARPLPPSKVYIINYDILSAWLPELRKLNAAYLAIDEAHMIKNRAAKRTKAVKRLSKKIPHVVAISGTPITNRPSELWSILNIVRPDLYPSFFAYAARYCKPERKRWGWEYKGATRLPELHGNLKAEMMLRRKKVDVLPDLPAKSISVIPLPLTRVKEYREAEADFIKWMIKTHPKKADKARNAERLMRFGYLRRLAGELKIPAVIDWINNFLEESDEKLILFGIHQKVLSAYFERFKRLAVLVNGTVGNRERQVRYDRFVKSKSCRLFVGNIQAAGVGWNGTIASTVAFAEMAWTPGEHDQAIDRVHRIGQTKKTQGIFLVGNGTVEDDLCKQLQKKSKVLAGVFDGKKTASLDVFSKLEEILIARSKKK